MKPHVRAISAWLNRTALKEQQASNVIRIRRTRWNDPHTDMSWWLLTSACEMQRLRRTILDHHRRP